MGNGLEQGEQVKYDRQCMLRGARRLTRQIYLSPRVNSPRIENEGADR